MKKLLLALALFLIPATASAQCSGQAGANTVCGNNTGAAASPKFFSIGTIPLTSAQLDTLFGTTQGQIIYRGASVWTTLLPATAAGLVLSSGGPASNIGWQAAGTGTVTSITVSNGLSPIGVITTSGTIAANIAQTTDIFADTTNKLLDASGAGLAVSPAALTFASPLSFNFANFINGSVKLTGNTTINNPSNVIPGRCGVIYLIQDGTGSRTWTFASPSSFKWAGGSVPALTTTAGATDMLSYCALSSTFIPASLNKDFK